MQCGESYVAIKVGEKNSPLGTLQHWKPKARPTLIPSEKQLKVWNQRFPAETAAEA